MTAKIIHNCEKTGVGLGCLGKMGKIKTLKNGKKVLKKYQKRAKRVRNVAKRVRFEYFLRRPLLFWLIQFRVHSFEFVEGKKDARCSIPDTRKGRGATGGQRVAFGVQGKVRISGNQVTR